MQRLRVLVAVGRHGSVSRAAAELLLSQPSVSLHLKAVSEMLGLAVLERHGRGVRLTEAGRALERHAARVLDELELARQTVERHRGLRTGTLHVGAGTTPGTYLLPELLGEFHRRLPGIELSLEIGPTEAIVERLHVGELHLGVVGEGPPHEDVERRPLVTDRLVCIVWPGHPAAASGMLAREQLALATLLTRPAGSSTQAVTDRYLTEHSLEVAERWVLDSPEAIKQAVRAGLGISFVSELTVSDELLDRRLSAVAVEGQPLPTRTLDVVRSTRHQLSPAEGAFLELLDQRGPSSGLANL